MKCVLVGMLDRNVFQHPARDFLRRKLFHSAGDCVPTFLITVFAKGEKDNLTKAERNDLAKLTKLLAAAYGK